MGSSSGFDIERNLAGAVRSYGYPEDRAIPLSVLRDATGYTALSNATTPEIAAMNTNFEVVKWDHGDTAANTVEFEFQMGREFAELQDHIQIRVPVRKVDSGGDENADLCLQAQIFAFEPGSLSDPAVQLSTGTVPGVVAGETTAITLTTVAKCLLPACNTSAANSNLTGWVTGILDIGERLRAEGKRIKAGAVVKIVIGPDDTVGSSDMDVEMGPPVLTVQRHANPDTAGFRPDSDKNR